MINIQNSLIKNIFILLKPYKMRIILLSISVLITSVISIFSPIINSKMIDDGIIAKNLDTVVQYILVLLGVFMLGQLLSFFELKQSIYINNMLSLSLFIKSFRKSMKLRMSYFNDTNITKIMSDVTQDVARISSITDKSILISCTQIFKILGGVIGLVLISWKLTLIVLSIIPVKLFLTALLTKLRAKIIKETMEANSQFSFWYGETLNGISEVKLWNLYSRKISEFIKHQRKLIKLKIRTAFMDEFNQASAMTLEALIFNGLYIIGAAMIINESFTIGGMFSFVMYSSYVTQPIALITNVFYQLSNVKPAMERYISFMNNEVEYHSGKELVALNSIEGFPDKITFDSVSLSYKNKNAVNSFSFEITKGEKIAIIGTNGSGKTSIINLLLRFYKPTNGRILMNNIDIEDININDYRELYSVMSQNIHLFNDTIEQNIKMNRDIPFEEMVKSCSKSDALSFIDKLDEKFKTAVGYRGSKLSGGEKQKVALARVLSKKASILVLDEATSNYDFESEQLFNKVIKESTSYQFVFVITHRPDILKLVDRILVVEKGCLVGNGTFNELYGNNGLFTKMVDNSSELRTPEEAYKEKKEIIASEQKVACSEEYTTNVSQGNYITQVIYEK